MPIIPDNVTRALKYWGNILAAASSGATTAELWQAIHAQQQQYGLETPQASATDVAILRGYANRIMNAASAYASASGDAALTAEMMGIAPYTDRSYQSISANPVYQVRFLNRVQRPDGSIVESYQTSVFQASDMPSTKDDLNAAIQFNADQLAQSGSESSDTTPNGTSLGATVASIVVV
jgi:hypothetical protein